MLEEFKTYVESFYTGDDSIDKMIKLKYNHSLRVRDIMVDLAKDLNLNKEEKEVALVIGLLHDYGRFYQWENYKTFFDRMSVDHADYGVKELFDKGDIKKYYSNQKYYDEIKDAIYYHNKYSAPLNKFNLMIRDADKLDIMHIHEEELILNGDGDINNEVINDFNNEKLVGYKNIVSNADNVIKMLAYIYDLNYKFSFNYIKKHKIIDNIYKNINDKEKFKYYFNKINKFIDNKIKETIEC